MKLEDIKTYCEEQGYSSRAERYKIMADYFGIGEGTIKDIMTFDRCLRWIFPADEVGMKKEAEYHKPEHLFDLDNRSKRLEKDLLKYS